MQGTNTVGQFVVFKKKKKRRCVNLKHVINSPDLYMSFDILKSKQSDKTSQFFSASFERRSQKSKLLGRRLRP